MNIYSTKEETSFDNRLRLCVETDSGLIAETRIFVLGARSAKWLTTALNDWERLRLMESAGAEWQTAADNNEDELNEYFEPSDAEILGNMPPCPETPAP